MRFLKRLEFPPRNTGALGERFPAAIRLQRGPFLEREEEAIMVPPLKLHAVNLLPRRARKAMPGSNRGNWLYDLRFSRRGLPSVPHFRRDRRRILGGLHDLATFFLTVRFFGVAFFLAIIFLPSRPS